MNKVIMPELITPKFAEVIAENPEVLKTIVDHQSGEKVIVGKNCTLDCNSNSTNVKLVFCNVTIGIDDTKDHIKISGREHEQEGWHWGKLENEISQLMLEVAVLEARMEDIKKILRLIPRQICNRKLVARCKKDMNEAAEHLAAKKKELEDKAWLTEFWE
ncbi:MAG: hypothetical protein APF77_09055 [Clostridia bacterium BRH_c25]|nr:MAG: hypothetical protein APF77_09055 [Clostridia bacterium BRH_c25]